MTNRNDFYLGDLHIEPLRGIIRKGNEERRVEPQIMAVLLRLCDEPGTVVTREEMLSTVWPDCVVNDGVLSKAMSILRKALGDQAKNPLFIQTIPKVGYRLIASVHPVPSVHMQRQVAVIPKSPAFADRAPRNSISRRDYGFRINTGNAFKYVALVAILGLIFMLRPQHIEIEEEITFMSPHQIQPAMMDSSNVHRDSVRTQERQFIYPASSVEVEVIQ